MFIPFITSLDGEIYPTKGGGRRGRGRTGGGNRSGRNRDGGGGWRDPSGRIGWGGPKGKATISLPGSSWWRRRQASSYSNGGGKPKIIPPGQQFAGRSSGGGRRGAVYGSRFVVIGTSHIFGGVDLRSCDTRIYGSGYPGYYGRGVNGLGFPFVFWPVVWGPGFGYGPRYLHNGSEVRVFFKSLPESVKVRSRN